MRRTFRDRRPSPALVIAVAALVVALGGTAVAAGHFIITKSSQVKPHALVTKNLSAGAVRSLRGQTGPPGQQGAQGATGPAGIVSVTTVDGPEAPMCASGGGSCQVALSTATCPGGSRVVGGGVDANTIEVFVSYERAGPTTYSVIGEDDGPSSGTIKAQAICASGPGIAAKVGVRNRAALSDAEGRLRALRGQK
jgi:hypothetical protein